jgi:carboxylesterase
VTKIVPGAEPFSFHGGPIGILMLHGLSGNPASLRRVGEWLAARGHTVSCPRYPGHGTDWHALARTRWQDWAAEATRALKDLDRRTESIVAFGLSVGGAMAMHLAARYPDAIKALVLVNPYVRDRRIAWAAALRFFVRTVKGTGNDIKRSGEDELAYDRLPVRSLAELARFLKVVDKEMPRVRQPLLLLQSSEDHVVPNGVAEWVIDRVGSPEKELVWLTNSYHVATLDHDAELIFERTHEFAEAHAAVGHRAEDLEEGDEDEETTAVVDVSEEAVEDAQSANESEQADERDTEPADERSEP